MKILKYSFVIIISFAMIACSSHDENSENRATNKTINIKPSVKSMQTRALSSDDLQNTYFNDGAKINVYLTNSTTVSSIDNLSSGYATYTYSQSSHIWTSSVSGLKYPADGTSVDAFGIYPATVTKDKTSFKVEYEQWDVDNYLKSDLMYAYSSGNTAINDPINLQFNHCLTKITIKLIPSAGMTKEEITNNIGDMYIDNITQNATLSFSDNKITATASGDQNGGVCISGSDCFSTEGVSCIIIPQRIPSGTQLFSVDVADKYYFYTTDQEITFNEGKEYIFTITLGDRSITSSYHNVKDWIPEDKIGTAL